MTAIDEIKSRLDIVELVSESVQLRKSGKNYTGFCPFHANTRTPAFVVFPDSGTWRCFGQCNEGGDIFKYVMKKEGWDFPEALRALAEKAGVTLKVPTPQEQAVAEEYDALRILLEDAVTFYRHNLLNTPAGKPVLEYLRTKRGLKDDTIEAFGLGYAPLSWDATLNYFKNKGHSEQELIDSGLVTVRESEGDKGKGIGATTSEPLIPSPLSPKHLYDRFRHRILIPIRDERARMAGFGARIINPDDVPKFLNSPQTPIFDKGRLLYGLDRARKAIRTAEQAVIVEGYLDVIALHQAGFANTVSPMGTALTDHQLYLLKRFTKNIVLALDPDAAGDKATLRGLQLARQTMDHESEPVFDARGLLSFEARLQADIRVTTLPPGMDPDDVVNRDPAEWQRILGNARPIVEHVMETLAVGRNLDDPKVKNEIAAQVLPLIEDVPNPIERDTYRQRLARLLRVDESAILGALPPSRHSRRSTSRLSAPGSRAASTSGEALLPPSVATSITSPGESHCIGIFLRRPDLIYRVDRAMQERGLTRLGSADFQLAEHQSLFTLIQESIEQEDVEPLNYVLNRLSLPMMDVADVLLHRTENMDPNEDKVLEDLVRALLELRRHHLRQGIEHLRFLMEEAQQQGDGMATEYQQSMLQYTVTLNRLYQAIGKYTERSTAQ
jgi:DNA primase